MGNFERKGERRWGRSVCIIWCGVEIRNLEFKRWNAMNKVRKNSKIDRCIKIKNYILILHSRQPPQDKLNAAKTDVFKLYLWLLLLQTFSSLDLISCRIYFCSRSKVYFINFDSFFLFYPNFHLIKILLGSYVYTLIHFDFYIYFFI